jgi:two-component sensor histidine kinase
MTFSQQLEMTAIPQALLDRQQAMLREVNHRAKNSVAMAIGLLRLQRERSKAPRVRQALDQAIRRLNHLARIHDILSRQQDGGSDLIDMPAYLAELCDSFFPVLAENVEIRLRADPIELPSWRAAPAALIVGEAVSNAIKHAFPLGRAGIVLVTLFRDANSAALTIEDTGVGRQAKARAGALGVRLMTEMAHSLGGVLTIDSDSGTRVSTSFLLESSKGLPGRADRPIDLRRRGSPVREIASSAPSPDG